AHAKTIEQLHRRLGEYEKDMLDRPERLLQCRTLEHEAREILQTLGQSPDLEQASQLRLRTDEPLRIQNLGNRQQALAANFANSLQAAETLRSRLERVREELAGLSDLPLTPHPSPQRGEGSVSGALSPLSPLAGRGLGG